MRALHERAVGWALNRSLAANSVTGISLMLGLCAAAWFTAGTRADDIRGALVLCCSYLAGRAARQLSASPVTTVGGNAAGRIAVGRNLVGTSAARGTSTARATGTASSGLLARVSSTAAECVVYAGLAVGGDAAGWSGMWVLAVTVMILVAVRQTMSDCCGATEEDSGHQGAVTRLASGVLTLPAGGRVLVVAVAAAVWGPRSALLGLLVWGIIVVGYAIGGYGPDVPASVDSTAAAGNSPGRASPVAGQGEPTGLAALLNLATPVPTELAAPAGPAGPAEYGGSKDVMTWSQPALMSNVRLLPGPESQQGELAPRNVTAPLDLAQPAGRAQPADLAQPVSSAQPADLAQPVDLTQRVSPAGALELLQPAELTGPLEVTGSLELTGPLDLGGLATASGPGPRLLATITACRDDGTFARYLGRLLRGNLIPLPPAIAGLAAASMLAVLGQRNLPGIIVLTPLVVMLLAAPGSGHPHDGRFDWLVPAVLQAGQYVYIATLGFASGVAPLAIFALCAMTTIRYADLAYRGRNAQPAATALASAGRRARKIDIGMGWEGRMLAAGLGVIIGVGTFAYLALTAYLGVLICSEVMTSRLAAGEDNRP